MELGIISCGKNKYYKKCEAKNLYTGEFFKASKKYVESVYKDNYCILSAKYHVLLPNDIVEPYDIYI